MKLVRAFFFKGNLISLFVELIFTLWGLPKGFQKVRYYGILHPKRRLLFNIIRLMLHAKFNPPEKYRNYESGCRCPVCGEKMIFIERLRAPPMEVYWS